MEHVNNFNAKISDVNEIPKILVTGINHWVLAKSIKSSK